jgi:FixJ family two-component response regulator
MMGQRFFADEVKSKGAKAAITKPVREKELMKAIRSCTK